MADIQLAPDIKPAEALKAFETILGELEKVRPLNYRSPLFTKWKSIVQGALGRFLGPDHPQAVAFAGLVFHGPMPKSPMDPPVSQKDIDAYAASLAKAREMLASLVTALQPAPEPAEPAAMPPPAASRAPSAPPPPAAADSGFKVTRGTSGEVSKFAASGAPVTAGVPPSSASQDLSRHSGGIPEGGLKIVSRSGVSSPTTTMDGYIEACTDPEEKALLVQFKAIMDDPGCTWEHAKHLLAELWWLRRDSVTKLLPIILRR